MKFRNLAEGAERLKNDNVLLSQQKATLLLDLNLLKGVELPTLADKIGRAQFLAESRKDVIGDLRNKLSVAKRSVLDMKEDNDHISEVKRNLEVKVNNLVDSLFLANFHPKKQPVVTKATPITPTKSTFFRLFECFCLTSMILLYYSFNFNV